MSAELDGMRQLRDTLERVKTEMRAKAQREIKRAALNVENGAKRRVPVDLGRLRNSIAHRMLNDGLNAEVGTNVKYAKAIEFGRLPGSMPPPGALLDWMKRKGIPEDAEFAIRKKIADEGSPAQPYLFPALEEERPKLLARLRTLDISVRR